MVCMRSYNAKVFLAPSPPALRAGWPRIVQPYGLTTTAHGPARICLPRVGGLFHDCIALPTTCKGYLLRPPTEAFGAVVSRGAPRPGICTSVCLRRLSKASVRGICPGICPGQYIMKGRHTATTRGCVTSICSYRSNAQALHMRRSPASSELDATSRTNVTQMALPTVQPTRPAASGRSRDSRRSAKLALPCGTVPEGATSAAYVHRPPASACHRRGRCGRGTRKGVY